MGSLLQNLNLQMARAEFSESGQQGLDQLLSVFSDEGDQVQTLVQHSFTTVPAGRAILSCPMRRPCKHPHRLLGSRQSRDQCVCCAASSAG